MTHPILAFLETGSVTDLEKHGIYARWSTRNPRKFSLNYDQIEAKDGDPLSQECRGLVLRQDHPGSLGSPGAYSVLAQPFRRFFNLGSGSAPVMDWSTAEFFDKLDGTLCIVYFDPELGNTTDALTKEGWCVATRSVPDADIGTPPFSTLFWEHHGRPGTAWNRDETHLFELTGPGNQIVCVYDAWSVSHLASYNRVTGKETHTGGLKGHRFESIDAAIAHVHAQPGIRFEGFVARDANGNRVKIKNQDYLAVAKSLTTAGSDAGLMLLVLNQTADDVLAFLPAPRRERLVAFEVAFAGWLGELHALVDQLKAEVPTTDRKEAAMRVQRTPFGPWVGVCLDLWTGAVPNFRASMMKKSQSKGEFPQSYVEKLANTIVDRVPTAASVNVVSDVSADISPAA